MDKWTKFSAQALSQTIIIVCETDELREPYNLIGIDVTNDVNKTQLPNRISGDILWTLDLKKNLD